MHSPNQALTEHSLETGISFVKICHLHHSLRKEQNIACLEVLEVQFFVWHVAYQFTLSPFNYFALAPELIKDPSYFSQDNLYNITRAELGPSSALYRSDFSTVVIIKWLLHLRTTWHTLGLKVGSIYLLWISIASHVQLAFYNDGKQIQLCDNYKQGQMCANPSMPTAKAACAVKRGIKKWGQPPWLLARTTSMTVKGLASQLLASDAVIKISAITSQLKLSLNQTCGVAVTIGQTKTVFYLLRLTQKDHCTCSWHWLLAEQHNSIPR